LACSVAELLSPDYTPIIKADYPKNTYFGHLFIYRRYTQPDIGLSYASGTPGSYPGLDQFDRVKQQFWAGYGSNSGAGLLGGYDYGYNLVGDVAYRQNLNAGSANLDQA